MLSFARGNVSSSDATRRGSRRKFCEWRILGRSEEAVGNVENVDDIVRSFSRSGAETKHEKAAQPDGLCDLVRSPILKKTPEQGVRERAIWRRDSQEPQRALKRPTHEGLRLNLPQPHASHKLPNPYNCI